MIGEAMRAVWRRRHPAAVLGLAGLVMAGVWVGLLWVPDHATAWVLLTGVLLTAAAVGSAWVLGTAVWVFAGLSLPEAFRRARGRIVPATAVVTLCAVALAWLGPRGFAFLFPLLLLPVATGAAAGGRRLLAHPGRLAGALVVWALGLAAALGVWWLRPAATGLTAETVSAVVRAAVALGIAASCAMVASALLGGGLAARE